MNVSHLLSLGFLAAVLTSPVQSSAGFSFGLAFSGSPSAGLGSRPVSNPAPQAGLIGIWRGTTGALRKRELMLQSGGACSLDGATGTWAFDGADRITLRLPTESFTATYALDGKKLELKIHGRRSRLRWKGAAGSAPAVDPKAKPEPEPVTRGPVTAPFAGAVAAARVHQWAGVYRSGEWSLDLASAGDATLNGTLQKDGQVWRIVLVATATGGAGCMTSAGATFPFHAVGTAEGLTLTCGVENRAFQRTGGGAGPAPALEGIATAPAKRYRDPDGYFSFEMPAEWTVQATEEGLFINPGFEATDTLDALIMVETGALQEGDKRFTPAQLIDRDEPDLRQAYVAEGIRLERPRQGSRAVRVGAYEGAVQEWKGELATGQAIDAWIGGATGKGYYITVAGIILSERQGEFLPHVKRILATMELSPPDRRPDLEQQFVGKRVRESTTSESGFFGTTYGFGAGGTVTSETFMSGSIGLDVASASMGDAGQYAVVGKTLYLRFDGKETAYDLGLDGKRVTGVWMGGKLRSLD